MTKKELSKRYGTVYISVFVRELNNISAVLSIGIILCTATVLATAPQQAVSQTFGPVMNLSNNSDHSGDATVVKSGNKVYVVWSNQDKDIFFKRSTDNGATFGPTINLSNDPGFSSDPRMAASGNSVYVLWDDATPGNFDIFFRASNNKGASFDDAINVSENSGDSGPPDMSRKGNSAYVVWEDITPGNSEILFKKGD